MMRDSHGAPSSLGELAPAIVRAELVHHVDSLEGGHTVARWGQPPKIASPRRSDPSIFGGLRGGVNATADAMLGFSSSASPGSAELDGNMLSPKRLEESLWHGRFLPNPRFDSGLTLRVVGKSVGSERALKMKESAPHPTPHCQTPSCHPTP